MCAPVKRGFGGHLCRGRGRGRGRQLCSATKSDLLMPPTIGCPGSRLLFYHALGGRAGLGRPRLRAHYLLVDCWRLAQKKVNQKARRMRALALQPPPVKCDGRVPLALNVQLARGHKRPAGWPAAARRPPPRPSRLIGVSACAWHTRARSLQDYSEPRSA